MLAEFMANHRLGDSFAETARQWYIPLAKRIMLHHSGARTAFFVGINGCQGSGKSTLAAFLQTYLQQQAKLNVVVLSLDDFYLSRQQRANLALQVHPLLQTRGVPGTHDVVSMKSVLQQLSETHRGLALPRFDKGRDDPVPMNQWPRIDTPVDVVLFEGWCWGVTAQSLQQLQSPVNSFEAEQDERLIWRQFVNNKLKSQYQPLYEYMDLWVMLKAPGFDRVFEWRLEQESKLAQSAGKGAKNIMSTQQICTFIQHYQRLTEHGLATLPAHCDVVFELDPQRHISAMNTREAYA